MNSNRYHKLPLRCRFRRPLEEATREGEQRIRLRPCERPTDLFTHQDTDHHTDDEQDRRPSNDEPVVYQVLLFMREHGPR